MSVYTKIIHWIIDYGYVCRGFVYRAIHRKPPSHYLEHIVHEKVAVVLIPGILGKWTLMKSLADKISLTGHPVYIVPELKSNTFNIPQSAEILKTVIEKMYQEVSTKRNSGVTKVVLVAHSKGGLIGKYFLTHLNTDHHVLGMISVATPFSGSTLARVIPHESFRELDTTSRVIKDLEDHTEMNHKIISICPEYDNHVWAEKGSYLKGAENIVVPVHGHHKVLFDKDVQNVVLKSIEKLTRTMV